MATPMIDRLLRQGLTRSEILDRINGPNNGNILSRQQLNAIGFKDTFVRNYLNAKNSSGNGTSREPYNWRQSPLIPDNLRNRPDPSAPSGGTGGTGAPGDPASPDPLLTYLQMQDAARAAEQARNQQSAFELFRNMLQSWGLPVGSDIEQIIRNAATDGITPDQIGLIIPDIQETQTWRNRFPGWHARVGNGYNQLTPGEYLALENSYHRILQSAGLPTGFYDTPSDFGQWIAGNVSPQEIQDRVDIAMDAVRRVDPTARDLLTQFYGVTSGDLASYFLDQKRALPVLDRQFKAVSVAQWAKRNGLNVRGSEFYEGLVDAGITEDAARDGFSTVRTLTDTFGSLGDIYGIDYGQSDAEEDVFFNRTDKRRRLVSMETATFSGRSAGDAGTANRGTSY